MKNGNYSKAKVLTLIPIIVLAVTVICMVLAIILEVSTNRGLLYSIFALIGLLSMFVSPLPCLVISIIGTVFAVKAAKEGTAGTLKYLLLGIMEIFAYAMGAIMAARMIIAVQGV